MPAQYTGTVRDAGAIENIADTCTTEITRKAKRHPVWTLDSKIVYCFDKWTRRETYVDAHGRPQ